MIRLSSLAILAGICFSAFSQDPAYEFQDKISLQATPVVSQGRTGTCWSFSTSSFLESEIRRIYGKTIDVSEMYNVRKTYPVKAENYLMRQGNAQFSEGGLAHDVINSVEKNGLVPQSAYTGLTENQKSYDHSKMAEILQETLDQYNKRPDGILDPHWQVSVDSILDLYMGKAPENFIYEGKEYTPRSFLEMTKLDPHKYITVTSFNHQPFYSSFILNIPDNFSNGSMYNVPLDEMIRIMDHALTNGYTIELDCDVSEPTFSARNGVAVVPAEAAMNEEALKHPVKEEIITQEYRQQLFENQSTTDDHLMHITGMAYDQNGAKYYKVKNSWGTGNRVAFGGYIYMSEAYIRLKAISIMIHKDALPKNVSRSLKI